MSLTLPKAFSGLANFASQIDAKFVQVFPGSPVRIPEFSSTGLPDATAYAAALIYLSDLNTVAFSDGAHWYPIQKAAHL